MYKAWVHRSAACMCHFMYVCYVCDEKLVCRHVLFRVYVHMYVCMYVCYIRDEKLLCRPVLLPTSSTTPRKHTKKTKDISSSSRLYIYIYIYIYTHTHTCTQTQTHHTKLHKSPTCDIPRARHNRAKNSPLLSLHSRFSAESHIRKVTRTLLRHIVAVNCIVGQHSILFFMQQLKLLRSLTRRGICAGRARVCGRSRHIEAVGAKFWRLLSAWRE